MNSDTDEAEVPPESTTQIYLLYMSIFCIELAALDWLQSFEYMFRKWTTAYVILWSTFGMASIRGFSGLIRLVVITYQIALVYGWVHMMEPPLNLEIFRWLGDPFWILFPALWIHSSLKSRGLVLRLAILTAFFPIWSLGLFWLQFVIASFC
jgi:hypothetical protein